MDVSQITQLTAAATSSGKSTSTGRNANDADTATPTPFADAMTQARKANTPSTESTETANPRSPELGSQRQDTATDDSMHASPAQTEDSVKLAAIAGQFQASSADLAAMLGNPEGNAATSAGDTTDADTDVDAIAALFASLPALQPLTQSATTESLGAQAAPATGSTPSSTLLAAVQAAMAGDGAAKGDSTSTGDQPSTEPRHTLATDDADETSLVRQATIQNRDGHDKVATIADDSVKARPTEPVFKLADANAVAQIQRAGDGGQPDIEQLPGRAGDQATGGLGNLASSQATSGASMTSTTPTSTAPAGATIPVAVNSPQWPASLGQQVLQMHQRGDHQMELRLHPQELGPLSLTLTVNDQQAQLHILSAHAPVRAAVEAAIPQLREALADSGIALGEAMVGDQGQFQQGQEERGNPSRLAMSGAESALSPLAEEPGEIALRQASSAINGNINLYA